MTRLDCRSRFGCAHRMTCAHRGFTFVELLVVAFLFVVLGTFALSCARRQHEGSGRVTCASNLRQIGQAILLYSNDHGGAFPQGKRSAGPDRKPTWGTGAPATQPSDPGGPEENDVTAALFLLLRTQDITSEVFVCPAGPKERDTYGGADKAPIDRSNFTDVKKNLSYSYQKSLPLRFGSEKRLSPR